MWAGTSTFREFPKRRNDNSSTDQDLGIPLDVPRDPIFMRIVSPFGDNDGHGVGNCKHAAVEGLVVKRIARFQLQEL